MYTCKKLEPPDWIRYSKLMFRWLEPQLPLLESQGRLLALGMEAGSQCEPVGLVVLELDFSRAQGCMQVMFITPEHRHRGLATALLREAQARCQQLQLNSINCAYYSGKSITPALEAWLGKTGWHAPQLEANVFHIDRSVAAAPWLRTGSLPAGLRLLPWIDIDRQERERLATLSPQPYPPFLSPFKTFAPLDGSISLAVQSEEGVEGWAIAYRLEAKTVLYDAVYISPRYQQTGIALMMLASSIRRQLETDIPYGMFTVNTETPAMFRLSRRWIAPYAWKVTEKRGTSLQL